MRRQIRAEGIYRSYPELQTAIEDTVKQRSKLLASGWREARSLELTSDGDRHYSITATMTKRKAPN